MDISFAQIIRVLSFTFSYFLCAIAEDGFYGLCKNPACSEPVGEGITLQRYLAHDSTKLSFVANERFEIYSKDVGRKKDLLGVMMKGRKGYVPNNLVREDKTLVSRNNLVPAAVDFITHDHYTNNVDSQVQSSSQWSHQGSQHHMHQSDSNFLAMEQSSSPWSQEDQSFMPESDEVQTRGHNFHSGHSYYYSGGPRESPEYHYSSSDEVYSYSDYVSPQLDPSVQVHVRSHIMIPSSHETNVEHFTSHQENTHHQAHHTYFSDNGHQDFQKQNVPLESSFSFQQENTYFSANLHSNEAHTSNFDFDVKSAETPSQVSMAQSQTNSKHIVRDTSQFQNLASNFHPSEHNQDLLDTFALLKKQGYDISAENHQYDQNVQGNMNPSQRVDFTQDNKGASYGYTSSLFENSNEKVSNSHTPAEDLVSSFPSSINGDKEMVETLEPPLFRQATPTVHEKATKSVYSVTITEEEDHEGSDYDENVENDDENDNEVDLEEEEDTVSDLTPSKDKDIKKQNETVDSNSELQETEKDNLSTSVTKNSEFKQNNDENSVPPPDVQPTHVLENRLKAHSYKSLENIIHKSDVVSSNQAEIVTEGVPSDFHLDSLVHKNLKENIGISELSDASLKQSNSVLVSKSVSDSSESSKSSQTSNNNVSESTSSINENVIEKSDEGHYTKVESELPKTGIFSFDKTDETLGIESVNETDIFSDKEQETELDKILNISEVSASENAGFFNPYQIRNLKEENGAEDSQNVESDEEPEDNGTYVEFDIYTSVENSLEAVRSFIELLLSWVPEPLYSIIMDVQKSGISPRVPVFTIISSIPCISLLIALVYIKEKSKEKKLTTLLALSEKNVYMLTAEKNILEEKIEKTAEELKSSSSTLDSERSTYETLKSEVDSLKQKVQKTNQELESSLEEIDTMKEREKEYAELVSDHEKAHLDLREEKIQVENKVLELDEAINILNGEIVEKDNEIDELQKEKLEFLQSSKDYEEKLSQLQQNCNQLLKEAEVWNMRVNELTSKLSEVSEARDEFESSFKLKDSEIESLTHLVQTLKSYEELQLSDPDEIKSNEEKLKEVLNSTSILIKLQNQEEENKALLERLSGEKNKILEMEVELLEAKSESDKLKSSYNRALQDKAEAQTKLDVLTNYFKDKEIQMQKQIGAQEAFREKREKDADSAERRICLIEQENTSYKYQVASMKQEMEETERNLKSQIATHEKKAHENWIAARAAERKLEDMKQEVTQLRQRLTLLEREQENWVNSSRDEIIRPVPKRISGLNDDSTSSQDLNNSMDLRHNIFPPPPPHPMMLPLDRPLPPLPPPPHHLPPFLPPPLEPHFRTQPWHLGPDSMPGSEYRITPPDFGRGRELTPPRGRHSAVIDSDMGPRQSSPLSGETRDSRNSTPPHSLPDFHDIPPPPRPFFHPPGAHPRYPLPPFRRDLNQGPRKTENPSDHGSGHGTQQSSVLQDNWSHSNSRV